MHRSGHMAAVSVIRRDAVKSTARLGEARICLPTCGLWQGASVVDLPRARQASSDAARSIRAVHERHARPHRLRDAGHVTRPHGYLERTLVRTRPLHLATRPVRRARWRRRRQPLDRGARGICGHVGPSVVSIRFQRGGPGWRWRVGSPPEPQTGRSIACFSHGARTSARRNPRPRVSRREARVSPDTRRAPAAIH